MERILERKKERIPNRLRLRRGGGGGVGGWGVFASLLEMSTSTKDTVSPDSRNEEGLEKEQLKGESE